MSDLPPTPDATRRLMRNFGATSMEAPVPTFPLDVLPPAVRAYVEAAAASLSVPAEMVAVPMLGFAGSVIGNRLHLILKHSYREYPTLFLAVVSPPGCAKTPALNLAQWPLDALQTDAMQAYREQLDRCREKLDAWGAAKGSDRGEKPAKPMLAADYYSSNLTLEALVEMLDRSAGVAIVKDEIAGWVASMNQYRAGKGSDRQEYLSLWSSKTIKLDRKGAEPIYRRFPVACVVGGIQPDLAGDLHHEAQKRDGFVERLLPVVPDVQPMPWSEESIDSSRYADVLAVFRALDRLPSADLGHSESNAVGIGVALSAGARRLFVDWFNDNQELSSNAHGLAAGFYAKLPAHVARIVLILHALWNPEDPRPMVSADRMEDAIELGEFFRAHISRFLALLHTSAPTAHAGLSARIVRTLRILRTDKDTTGESWASRSDLLHRLGNVKADDLTAALTALQEAETIERRALTTTTKPVEQWRLAPSSDLFPPSKYSDFSNYSRQAQESSNTSNTSNPLSHLNGHDTAVEDTARRLAALTVDELAAYRHELTTASPDDPHLVVDRQALALFEMMRTVGAIA